MEAVRLMKISIAQKWLSTADLEGKSGSKLDRQVKQFPMQHQGLSQRHFYAKIL